MTADLDRDRYLLTPDEAQRIFTDDIAPERLTGTAQQEPVVVFVAGQPGAGKSVAQAAVLAQLGRADAVAIDVDDLRTYHPRYEQLALAEDRTAAAYTQRDAQRWLRMAIADTTLRCPPPSATRVGHLLGTADAAIFTRVDVARCRRRRLVARPLCHHRHAHPAPRPSPETAVETRRTDLERGVPAITPDAICAPLVVSV